MKANWCHPCGRWNQPGEPCPRCQRLAAVGVIIEGLMDWWDVADTESLVERESLLDALDAVADLLGDMKPPPAPKAYLLMLQFRQLPDLNQIPLAVMERWTPEQRTAASEWAGEWDMWTSDIVHWQISQAPDVLKPFLNPPYGTRGAR